MPGVVESIHIAPRAKQLPDAVERATAVAGRGLEGDRYHDGKGSFSHWRGRRDLTLIEAEALEEVELDPAEARRNVVVRGLDLNALVGRRFRVGAVECEGVELNPPCKHLERLTRPGVLKALAGRGGVRAAILADGEIAVGDAVEPL
ncbi:MAG: MOSC domain-containing protein [Actinomycetota bacterium]|nr:MOSC domain-containing protein [Actinomycetota bacterium]